MKNNDSKTNKYKLKKFNGNTYTIINYWIKKYIILLVFIQNIKNTFNSRIIVEAESATSSNNIISNNILQYLTAIYINGEKQNSTSTFTPGKNKKNVYIFEFIPSFQNCKAMFFNCKSITYVNLSEFDTSSCEDMTNMFAACKALKSIDFGQIDTSHVTDMSSMFTKSSLVYLNLTAFDTTNVKNMASMFSTMSNLLSLDLSSFNTTQVTNMGTMFSSCSKLISLRITNFDITNVKNTQNMFTGLISYYIKFCYNREEEQELYSKMLKIMGTSVVNKCNDPCFTNPSNKFIHDSYICVINCYDTNNTKYEYNNQCYESCDYKTISSIAMLSPNVPYLCIDKIECSDGYYNYERTGCIDTIPEGYYCDNEIEKTIDKCDNKCKTCDNKELCKICNINYYPLENDPLNKNGYIECYNSTPYRTYLDINDNIYKLCYETCLSCSQGGNEINHNCIECNPGLRNDYLPNCYKNCSDYHYFDEDNKYKCEESCPNDYKIIRDIKKCTKDCRNEYPYIYEFNNKCIIECPNGYHAPNEDKKCLLKLQCENYYNYDYNDCWTVIPEGFFCNDSIAKTTDKCNIKCKTCNLESSTKNLCIQCNNLENYYEVDNNDLKIDDYVECFNTSPETYFFDNENKKYKKCYKTCKECDELGNNENHKCINCYSNYTLNNTNCYEICEYYYYFDINKEYHCTINEQCPLDKNKLIIDKNECVDNCINEYKYKLNNKCYKYCPENSYYNYEHTKCIEYIPDGYYLNDTQTIDKCNKKCEKCDKNSTKYNLCIKCNNSLNYYKKEDDNIIEGYYDCFTGEQDGYYLDKDNNEYKKCYKTCKSCDEKGIITDNKCTKCYPNDTLIKTNCYKICKYYYYFDDNKEYHCTLEKKCPDLRNKLIEEKNECIKECNNEYKYEFNNKCYKVCPQNLYYNYNQSKCIDSIPEGYYLNDTIKRTINKCEIKCDNECILNFETNNILCKSCNIIENYYKKEDGEEKDGYYNCYKGTLEKYYYDNITNQYKKCYKTCKYCNELGNNENHKCINCYSNYTLNNTNCYEICKYNYYFDINKEYHCTENELCPIEFPNIIIEKNKCVKNCTEDDNIFKYHYNKRCYETCPNSTQISKKFFYVCESELICDKYYNYEHNACLEEIPDGFYLNDTEGKTIDKCDEKCLTCNNESINLNLCLSCNNLKKYYKKKEDNNNKNNFIKCYNISLLLEGYYLDLNNNYFDKCYEKCKKCNGKGIKTNHRCIECNKGFTLNGTNCYEICQHYYYFDSNKVYHCTENEECPSKYYFIPEKKQCIDNCKNDDIYIYEHEGICFNEPYVPNCTNNSMFIMTETGECIEECNGESFFNKICKLRNNNQTNQEYLLSTIRNLIKNGSIDEIISDLLDKEVSNDINNKYMNIDTGISFHLKSSGNNIIYNNNISSINLGECEKILKEKYNISQNLSLIILKIDYYIDNFIIPIIGYDVYHPITKEKLNLSICKNIYINIEYPTLTDDSSINKYIPDNDYYINECIPYTTEKGTDMTLSYRQKEYFDKHLSICERNCFFKKYDKKTKKSICTCQIKTEEFSIYELSKKNDLFKLNFKEKEKSIINILKCSSILFSKNSLKKNIAFYIYLFLLLLFVTNFIQFYRKGYNKLINQINDILSSKEKKTESENIQNGQKVENIDEFYSEKELNNKNVLKLKTPKNFRYIFKGSIAQDDINFSDNYSNNQKSINKLNTLKLKDLSRKKRTNIYNFKSNCHQRKTEVEIKVSISEYRINNFNYKEAIGLDIRTFNKIYISFIKYKHPILFLFSTNEDHNSFLVKINLIIISISLYYVVNALFITKPKINQMYIEGNTNKINIFIPQILASFIICYIIDKIIKYFSMSDKAIYSIDNEVLYNNMKIKANKVKKILKIKYIIFYALSFIFLLFSGFYLSLFSAVYQNTQIILIKNFLISYTISLLFPFIINIIPCELRRYSLKESNRDFIFNLSTYLHFL